MNRRDPTASSGCIRWPTHLHNTCEGGMFVYAIVPSLEVDSFRHCCGVPQARLLYCEVLVEPDQDACKVSDERGEVRPAERRLFPDIHKATEIEYYLSVQLLAAVCLGSSGGSWYDEERKCTWVCLRDDLTDDGRALVEALERLYGRPVELLTWLDT